MCMRRKLEGLNFYQFQLDIWRVVLSYGKSLQLSYLAIDHCCLQGDEQTNHMII